MERKIALVTGASSGLGESLARLLVYEDYLVIGLARREEKLNHLKEILGSKFIFFPCDVTKISDINYVSEKLIKKKIFPNLFFLNAGYLEYEDHKTFNTKLHKKNFEVNYFGAIIWIEKWLPICLEKGGTFIAISSLAGKQAIPNLASYCATKAALAKTIESLQIQYHNTKVKFVNVYPGFIDTALLKSNKKTPFIIKPLDAAKYIIKKVEKGKTNISFPFIYNILIFFASFVPKPILKKIFSKHSSIFNEQSKSN